MGLMDQLFNKKKEESDHTLIHSKVFTIIPPAIKSGEVFYFTTDSGTQYEVRLGKIKDSLNRVINFNVMNDEYADNEYAATNKGEIYSVVSTVIEILKMYIAEHPYIRGYEFTGEFKEENKGRATSIRTMFFCRALSRAFPEWHVSIEGNKGKLSK